MKRLLLPVLLLILGVMVAIPVLADSDKEVQAIVLLQTPDKTEYIAHVDGYFASDLPGAPFLYVLDLQGLQLEVHYSDGSRKQYTCNAHEYTFEDAVFVFDTAQEESPWDVGEQTVTVFYKGQRCTFTVAVIQNPVTALSLAQAPAKTQYILQSDGVLQERYDPQSDSLQPYYQYPYALAGLQVAVYVPQPEALPAGLDVHYDAAAQSAYILYCFERDFFSFMGYPVTFLDEQALTPWDTGPQTIRMSFMGHTLDIAVAVVPNYVTAVTLLQTPDTTVYTENAQGYYPLDLTGLALRIHYADGSEHIYDYATHGYRYAGDTVHILDGQNTAVWTPGEHTVTVLYRGFSVPFSVTVQAREVQKIAVIQPPARTVYPLAGMQASALDFTGLELQITYTNGEQETLPYPTDGSDTLAGHPLSAALPSSLALGKTAVVVQYRGQQCTFFITLAETAIRSYPAQSAFSALWVGDTIAFTGGDTAQELSVQPQAAGVSLSQITLDGTHYTLLHFSAAGQYEIEIAIHEAGKPQNRLAAQTYTFHVTQPTKPVTLTTHLPQSLLVGQSLPAGIWAQAENLRYGLACLQTDADFSQQFFTPHTQEAAQAQFVQLGRSLTCRMPAGYTAFAGGDCAVGFSLFDPAAGRTVSLGSAVVAVAEPSVTLPAPELALVGDSWDFYGLLQPVAADSNSDGCKAVLYNAQLEVLQGGHLLTRGTAEKTSFSYQESLCFTGAGTVQLRLTFTPVRTCETCMPQDLPRYVKDITFTIKTPLTGTVAIAGTPAYGQTLIADLTQLQAAGATLHYLWQRGETPVGFTESYTAGPLDIGQQLTLVVTASGSHVGSVCSAPVLLGKAACAAAPVQPTVVTQDMQSITLQQVTGCEYRINGAKWQVSPVFTGLSPNTAYTFTARWQETPLTRAGEESPPCVASTSAITLGGTVSILGTVQFGETLVANTAALTPAGASVTYRWLRDGLLQSTEKSYTLQQADIDGSICLQVVGTGSYAGLLSSGSFTVLRLPTEIPPAPTLVSLTQTEVILAEREGIQLRLGEDGLWQEGGVFTSLSPGTAYLFYARVKRTDTHEASKASVPLCVQTPGAGLFGTLTIAGTPRYLETLTAVVDGVPAHTQLQYSWKRGDTVVGDAETYVVQREDIGQQLHVQVNAPAAGSLTSAAVNCEKAIQNSACAPPVLQKATATGIELQTAAGLEYCIQGGPWQTSGSFTGLQAGTAYLFYCRLQATQTHEAGADSQPLLAQTLAAPITEITSDLYAINKKAGLISRVPLATDAATFLSHVSPAGVEVQHAGAPLPAAGVVGTGSSAVLAYNGQVVHTLALVVTGDLNADGLGTLTDYVLLKSHLLSRQMLGEPFCFAADLNADTTVSLTDFVLYKSHLLAKKSINAQAY